MTTDYSKFPKYLDTKTICRNHSKVWTMWLYHRVVSPNNADGMANSVDPDQTAPLWVCAVCPGISVRKLWIMVDWVCNICPDLYVRKLRIITVDWVYNICPDLYVQKLRIITVDCVYNICPDLYVRKLRIITVIRQLWKLGRCKNNGSNIQT